jgi:hypothetical protein
MKSYFEDLTSNELASNYHKKVTAAIVAHRLCSHIGISVEKHDCLLPEITVARGYCSRRCCSPARMNNALKV